MSGSASIFGSFDWSGWYGFFLALGVTELGKWFVPVMFAIAVLCLLGILRAIFKVVRGRK